MRPKRTRRKGRTACPDAHPFRFASAAGLGYRRGSERGAFSTCIFFQLNGLAPPFIAATGL